MRTARRTGAHPTGRAAIDILLGLLASGDGAAPGPPGEWVSAYQRVTHYLRAIDVWSPPPHLLAWTVVARAARRGANGGGGAPPLWLAMEEVHAMLSCERDAVAGAPRSRLVWEGSVRWRVGLWAAGGGRVAAAASAPPRDDAGRRGRVPEPVPAAAPAPMMPQPLSGLTLARLFSALSRMALWPAPASGRGRRHA